MSLPIQITKLINQVFGYILCMLYTTYHKNTFGIYLQKKVHIIQITKLITQVFGYILCMLYTTYYKNTSGIYLQKKVHIM